MAGRRASEDEVAAALRRVRALARVMDTAIGIPGTRWRLGLDPLLGLLPGVGDAVALGIALYPVVVARRLGVSKAVQARMVGNVLLDGVVGAVPLAGDVFDVALKANVRNLRLLEAALGRAVPPPDVGGAAAG